MHRHWLRRRQKKSRRLVQSKTPANEIDIADGLDNTFRNGKSRKD
jgi:hypothetical protein